jgi:hypothetical protein
MIEIKIPNWAKLSTRQVEIEVEWHRSAYSVPFKLGYHTLMVFYSVARDG